LGRGARVTGIFNRKTKGRKRKINMKQKSRGIFATDSCGTCTGGG